MFSSRSSISVVAVAPTSSSLIADSWRSFSAAPGWSAYIASDGCAADARAALGLVGLRRLLPALAPRLGLLEQRLGREPERVIGRRLREALERRRGLARELVHHRRVRDQLQRRRLEAPALRLVPQPLALGLELGLAVVEDPVRRRDRLRLELAAELLVLVVERRGRVVEPFQDVLVEPGPLGPPQQRRRDRRAAGSAR